MAGKKRLAKKVPARKKAAKVAPPTKLAPVAPKPAKVAQSSDDAGDELMARIDAHHYASSKVTARDRKDFYEYIASECQSRVATIESELGDEDEGADESEGDEGDGDDDSDDDDESDDEDDS